MPTVARGERISKLVCALIAALGVVGAGCSSDDAASPPSTTPMTIVTTAPASTQGATIAVATTAVATTAATVPEPVIYPAGSQFDTLATVWPVAPVDRVGDQFVAFASELPAGVTCPDPVHLCAPLDAVLYRSTDGGSPERVVLDTAASYDRRGITGDPVELRPRAMAVGDRGFVVAGEASVFEPAGAQRHERGLLWFSSDGDTWQRIDLREVFPRSDSTVSDVIGTEAGFVAVATVGDDREREPTVGVILRSSDGLTWDAIATLTHPFSFRTGSILQIGERLVVEGREYVCNTTGDFFVDVARQQRLWSSQDGGTTWQPVDIEATGVAGPVPPPATPETCAPSPDGRLTEAWADRLFAVVGTADGALVVRSADGTTVSVSTDLQTWTTAALPEAVAPTGDQGAQRVVDHAGAWYLTSLEGFKHERDDPDTPTQAVQPITWRSDDRGRTWERLDPARPLLAVDLDARIVGDGEIALAASTTAGAATVYPSRAQAFVEWTVCNPAPQATCAFATLPPGTDLDGLDLHGIDFTGAELNGASMAGTDLAGARFTGARVDGVDMTGADLSGADLRFLDGLFVADLTGATLTGADLSRSTIRGEQLLDAHRGGATLTGTEVFVSDDTTLRDADLTGLVLTGGAISAYKGAALGLILDRADLRGVTISGLDLTGASFAGADLTGASLLDVVLADADVSGAVLAGTTATAGVVCPDGQPRGSGDPRFEVGCRL
jgi:uncharacterized protein YjbI with pentapeptide repeats